MLKNCNIKNKQRTLKLRNGVTLTQEKSNFTSHLCQIETRFAYYFTAALWGRVNRNLEDDGLFFESDARFEGGSEGGELEAICAPWKLRRSVGSMKWVHCCTRVKDDEGGFSPFRRVYTMDVSKSASVC